MAVTQSTPIAIGTTAVDSADIVVDAGAVVTVSLFSATTGLKSDTPVTIYQKTPSAKNVVGQLVGDRMSWQLFGPGTFVVSRPVLSTAFGVCLDV